MRLGVLPSIRAIPLHMEQLFYHLIHNAIKFSKIDVPPIINIYSVELEPDQIKTLIPAEKKLKYFEVHVEDNGIGIEKSHLEKIFDIFTTLAYERTLEGFGVGLAYCRKIIRIHGGIITAQSELGKGATFSIILPQERN